jgi:hypothetical protein
MAAFAKSWRGNKAPAGASPASVYCKSMPLLPPPKTILAIAAVTDIALNPGTFPIRAKAPATRLGLQNVRLSAGSQH